jgi:hypothetical protein
MQAKLGERQRDAAGDPSRMLHQVDINGGAGKNSGREQRA